jgi:outer membrane receptor for ferrienterochelin and colicin
MVRPAISNAFPAGRRSRTVGATPLFIVAVIILLAASAAGAANAPTTRTSQGPATNTATNRFPANAPPDNAKWTDTSGSELLLFQEMPLVVSSARQSQPINLSSVPISIISADDIHYGARTTLPEILQFAPGVDVNRIDRNDYAVGVRGLHETIADRTLTLIDGRDATSPAFGGTDFLSLPVMLEDIDRIEIVLGPGGAAWGANALNGVINIITKKPEDAQGFLASTTVDQFGDTYNQFRWGAAAGRWTWRLSAGYETRVSSSDALDGNLGVVYSVPTIAPILHPANLDNSDFSRNIRLDSQAAYRFSDQTTLTFGLASADEQRGAGEFVGVFPVERHDIDAARAFVKLDYKPGNDQSGYLQWFTNYTADTNPALADYKTVENDLEGQWNFLASPSQKLTVGGNLREAYTNYARSQPTDLDTGITNEYWAGLFAIDRWQAGKRLALEGQIRGDYYSATNADWSGRMTALYSLDALDHNVLRISGARAFRTPMSGISNLGGGRVQVPGAPPGFDAVNFLANPNLRNEHITALEAGYSSQLSDGLSFRFDGYYQRYSSLIGNRVIQTPALTGQQINQLQNMAGADGYGFATELAYSRKPFSGSIWYSQNDFAADDTSQDTRSFKPIQHQAGIGARWAVGAGWTLSSNYKFAGPTYATDGTRTFLAAPSTNQLDFTIAKSLFQNHAEITLGVADILNSTESAVADESTFLQHNIPGRSVFARLQARW